MRAYKTEIILTAEQQAIYNKTIGVCRFVYNLFVEINDKRLENKQPYLNNFAFSKWLNNEYLLENPDKIWIKEVSSKAVRDAIDNAHNAYMRFFKAKKEKGYVPYSKKQIEHAARIDKPLRYYDFQYHPKYKCKGKNDCNYYFVRNSKDQPIQAERHRIKIPMLGWVQLKEYGYIPTEGNVITSGTITRQAGRYYISVTTNEEQVIQQNNINAGIGIDLGVKDFAVISEGKVYKTDKQKKLNKKLRREQRKLSRKYENHKTRGGTARNIEKQKDKVAKLHQRISNVRNDNQNKIVDEIVRTKPFYITIEDLNIRGMMKNQHLSKAIANQGLTNFVNKLTIKAKLNGIEVRKADRYYPSSKLCHECGQIKTDLKLSDRIYTCECGYICDRDLNAARNLRDCKSYKIV